MSTEERLRRELRAMAVVNRQLQAQLEGQPAPATSPAKGAAPAPAPRSNVRRGGVATAWLGELADRLPGETPVLVKAPDGPVYLVEEGRRRLVRSGLLAAALEHHLGSKRATVAEADIERLPEGPPVEIVEGPSGPPFVIVGGYRLPVRGLPLPHPVAAADLDRFPQGAEIDVYRSNTPPPPPPPAPSAIGKARELLKGIPAARQAARTARRLLKPKPKA